MSRPARSTSQRPAAEKQSGLPAREWGDGASAPPAGRREAERRAGRSHGLEKRRPGEWKLRPDFRASFHGLRGFLRDVKRLVLGPPIATRDESEERLSRTRALAVFSSDALSSVAYGTEQIMKVLLVAGTGALALTVPLATVVVVLLAVVVLSYRQTIGAYPSGGGSYIVASENLGTLPGLTAAAALMTDYLLTVAVSVAAGVAAITSLAPPLLPWTVAMSLGAVAAIAIGNLRGLRNAGTVFAVPTYAFVAITYGLLAWGAYRLLDGGLQYVPPSSAVAPGSEALSLFLILTAFSQGCSAMTGTEAISNGVPAFRSPEPDNARATLVWMGLLLGSMFLGLSVLATHVGVRPAEAETVLSQLGRAVFGTGPLWVALQVATALILILAANTSFADFPRLASILARDGFLHRGFAFRGDRLAFSSGIVVLAALACVLLVVFEGSVDRLIPLYAVGVFTSFTLSQTGMVVHWWRHRDPNWRRSAVVNGAGAVATAAVTLIIATTKFLHGAWLVLLVIPLLIALFLGIHRYYSRLAPAQRPRDAELSEAVRLRVVVPVSTLGLAARRAIAYARAIAGEDGHVVAVHVVDDLAVGDAFRREWETRVPGLPLELIESPYRALVGPLVAYVETLRQAHPDDTVTVVIPELVPTHWWQRLLHNQNALRLKGELLFHPGVVVASVPYLWSA